MDVTPDELSEIMAAMAVDALDDEESGAAEALLAAHPERAEELDGMRQAAAWLGAEAAQPAPAGLGGRVFDAALARRAGGRHLAVHAAGVPEPVDALAGEAADLAALLATLTPAQWSAPTRTGLSVHELMAHLLAVEDYTGFLLGLWPVAIDPATVLQHVVMTRPTIDDWQGRPSAELATTWRERVDTVIAGFRGTAAAQRYQFHYLDLSVRSLIVLRSFELWVHGDDILDAVGRPPSLGDPGRIHRMAELAVRGLPLALAFSGTSVDGTTARIVLTGPGGGAWNQALGSHPAGDPTVNLVADVHDFCRLVSHRLSPDQLDVDISGDVELGRAVLVAAQVFDA